MKIRNEQEAIAVAETILSADADGLCVCLGQLVQYRGQMDEAKRRLLVQALALRLAVRVMQPGWCAETPAPHET